jgi:membrane dipeptidase
MDSRSLLHDALVIDAHNDTIVAHIRRGNESIAQPGASVDPAFNGVVSGPYSPPPGLYEPLQIDLPRMRDAGIDAGFFAIDVTLARNAHAAYALDGIGFLRHDLASHGSDAVLVRRSQDIVDARAQGRTAVLLAIEHANCTERSLNVVDAFYALGVRSIGLTHNLSSVAADGCGEARDGVGLTRFGLDLVREMNRLGMLVDLAHISPAGFFHALDVSTRPVIFSHGNARALCDHPRNLTDDQLRALAQHGGVIGLSYVPMFVDTHEPTLARLLDHFDHIADVAGVDALALGSDFDGGGTLLRDAQAVAGIVEGLTARGCAEADLRKILGLNALRVLQGAIG